jgi:chemotaxis protein CheX
MLAQLDEQCLIRANSQFWEQMLAMTVDPLPRHEGFSAAAGHLAGSVDLSGAWNGRIEVRMAEQLARDATAAMLMQRADQVGEEDTLDAIREIANMIGGLIKSALPRPCSMALPQASVETEDFSGKPQSENSVTVVFRREAGGLMMVRVCEREYERGNG